MLMENVFFNRKTNIDFIDLLSRPEVTTSSKIKRSEEKRLRARTKRRKKKT